MRQMQCALHCLITLKLMRLKTLLKDRPHERQHKSRSVYCRLFFYSFSVPNGMAIFWRGPPNAGVEYRGYRAFWPVGYVALSREWYKLLTVAGIESRVFERRHFQWPWTIFNSDFKVTPLFDAEFLRNGTRYRPTYNGILIGTYTRITQMTLSEIEWLGEIFNDRSHRAVSLRQLIELLVVIKQDNYWSKKCHFSYIQSI